MPKIRHGRSTHQPGPTQLAQPVADRSASPRHSAPGAVVQRALAASSTPRPAEVMAMQRSLGNRAVTAMLGRLPVGGRKLPDGMRGKMEAALSADFSSVRVHVGPQAEQIGASAFTIGPDIHFIPGWFRPDTPSGQQLLRHELTHVVQQRAGRVRNPLGTGLAVIQDPMLEAEANRSGKHAAADRGAVQAEVAQSRSAPGSGRVLQANSLGELANPKVFTLPAQEIQIQDDLIKNLEKFVTKSDRNIDSEIQQATPLINLGTIKSPIDLTDLPLEKLIDQSTLTASGGAPIKVQSSYEELKIFEETEGTHLLSDIKTNVLNTLQRAGQIQYLRNRKISDADWKVLVDVHYFRDRPTDAIQFHKDTIGDTLFVNLNFITMSEIPGPEYILKPRLDPDREGRVKDTLPPKFRKDLASARKQLPEPREIGGTRVPANGIVSFVDELIHHTTPLRGRRTVSSYNLGHFFDTTFPRRFAVGQLAYSGATRQYFNGPGRAENTKDAKFNEDKIAATGLETKYIDKLFEGYPNRNERGLLNVSVKHGDQTKNSPIRDPASEAARLKREMSAGPRRAGCRRKCRANGAFLEPGCAPLLGNETVLMEKDPVTPVQPVPQLERADVGQS